jgi:hypothetical protein
MFNKKKKESADTVLTGTVLKAPAASAAASTEIIAVITAAIAALTGNDAVSANGLIIRKISRISGEKVTWSNAGLMECIDSRKF